MVEATLRVVDLNVAYTAVHATRGKVVRAEPIAALYEQGRIHHVGAFPTLEDQMCAFTSDLDRKAAGSVAGKDAAGNGYVLGDNSGHYPPTDWAKRAIALYRQPTLLADLEALVEPTTRGDPELPLRWTCKSVRRLAQALQAQGHEVSRTLVGHLLNEAGYSLQGNRKTTEGDSHPDRDAQFGYINSQVTAALAEHQPVISVDTKKKELVGDFRNNGREYRPQGNPEEVRVHDFLIKELGRAVPYGIYDLATNCGWVSVGVDHDTAAFAVNSIRQWWQAVGRARYPNASLLLITADGGGSNGSRVRLWKRELQKLTNELGLDIVVSHLPPGTSKWNKIEHRLFSFISQNWRAQPLVSYRVIVELISATTTKTGLTVRCELDTGQYPSGIVVSDAEMAAINIKRAEFHGEWNYTISPDTHPPNHALIS